MRHSFVPPKPHANRARHLASHPQSRTNQLAHTMLNAELKTKSRPTLPARSLLCLTTTALIIRFSTLPTPIVVVRLVPPQQIVPAVIGSLRSAVLIASSSSTTLALLTKGNWPIRMLRTINSLPFFRMGPAGTSCTFLLRSLDTVVDVESSRERSTFINQVWNRCVHLVVVSF